jgi:hypothetical protein
MKDISSIRNLGRGIRCCQHTRIIILHTYITGQSIGRFAISGLGASRQPLEACQIGGLKRSQSPISKSLSTDFSLVASHETWRSRVNLEKLTVAHVIKKTTAVDTEPHQSSSHSYKNTHEFHFSITLLPTPR